MMRNIAIGLAAATIAIGGLTLRCRLFMAGERHQQGSMTVSVKSHRFGPRTYGFTTRTRSGNRFSEVTRIQRERLRRSCANASATSPRCNRAVRELARERMRGLTPTATRASQGDRASDAS